ncbi:uncharacterized protein LOC144449821 [Glandiceps talaboti]
MPFFGKKKKKKKPEPPQRANTTRLSTIDNIYETSVPISSSKRKGQTYMVSAQPQSVHSNSNNTSAARASNNSQVPIASHNRSSSKKSAPPPPPRTVSNEFDDSSLAAGNHNAASTVVFNDYYDGSVSSQNVNGDDDMPDEDDFDVNPWQITPVEEWNDQDVIDWLQAVKLDYFVVIFEGCGIDGDYLLQVTENDLIELDIEEEDVRKKFMVEVEKLKKRPKSQPVLKLQEQHSVKRKALEEELNSKVSGELEELLKLQEDQECRIDASIAKLKEEQKLTDELISHNQKSIQQSPQKVNSPSLNSTATSDQTESGLGRSGSIITPPVTFINDLSSGDFEKPVTEWTEEEVLMWLDVVGLGKHGDSFKSKHITGKHLAEIDLQLLEDMNIMSADEREEVLSKIYELFNPPSGVDQDQLMDEAKKTKGYEREKYMAAVSALKSQDSVQLPPPSLSNSSSTNSSVKSVESKTVAKNGSGETKKKSSSGLSKFKGVINPKKKTVKDSNTVQVWSSITQPGKSRCDSFQVTDSTTTEELIHQCLDTQNLIEDHRLYCIVEAPIESNDIDEAVPERELRVNEQPLKIQKSWPDLSSYRFELRQRQGGSIKIMDRITGHKANGKTVTVSPSTPCYQVLELVLKKFDMKNVDTSLFCLLELDSNGDLRLVQDMEIPAQLNSDRFILCDKANMENQMAITEDRENNDIDVLRRHSSSNSQNSKLSSSSKMASIQLELSQNTSNTSESNSKPWVNKYRDLEREELQEKLAELEITVLQLQDEKKMNTNQVSAIMKENQKLQEKDKMLIVLQKTMSTLEENFRKQQSQMKKNMDLKTNEGSRDVLPLAVADLKAQLEQTTHEVQAKERQIQKLHQELKLSQRDGVTSTGSSELEYKITLEESSLLSLMQKQSLQVTDMEMSRYQHQMEQEKKQEETRAKNKQQSTTLHSLLSPEEEYTVVAVEIVPGHYGYDFIVSSSDYEEEGVYVTSCDTNSVLKEGDRILEVNGINVCQATDAEVNTMLNSKMSARIVVLRDQQQQQPITSIETNKELASMKEDLSEAKEELQSERKQNTQLKGELSRLQEVESQLNKRNQEKDENVQQLENQLSESQSRCQELETAVDDLQEALARQADKEKTLDHLQQQNHKLEVEIKKTRTALAESAKRIHKLDVACIQKDNDLSAVTDERNDLAQQLEDTQGKRNNSVVYLHDDELPLWEVLKTADKTEILKVLRENIEESRRQKTYLDQLYALMLDQAPSLLEQMDEEFDEEDLSGDEEFC